MGPVPIEVFFAVFHFALSLLGHFFKTSQLFFSLSLLFLPVFFSLSFNFLSISSIFFFLENRLMAYSRRIASSFVSKLS